MKIHITFFLLLTFCFTNLQSQSSGYFGKKLGVSFELNTGTSFGLFGNYSKPKTYVEVNSNNTYATYSKEYSPLRLLIKPTVTLNYALNNKFSVVGVFRYFAPNVHTSGFSDLGVNYYPVSPIKMTTISVGALCRQYVSNSINPIGFYFQYGMEYISASFDESTAKFYPEDASANSAPKTPSNLSANSVRFLAGVGKQYPITKFSLFYLGVDMGFLSHIIKGEYSDANSDTWAQNNLNYEMLPFSFFQFSFGITFM